MPDDLYDDGGSDTAVETPAGEAPEKKSEGAATGLLDKAFFGDKELKPGVRCEVEVDRVMDDQVIVKKVPDSEYKSKDDMMPEGGMMKESSIDDMME